jgi:hypothetical protein
MICTLLKKAFVSMHERCRHACVWSSVSTWWVQRRRHGCHRNTSYTHSRIRTIYLRARECAPQQMVSEAQPICMCVCVSLSLSLGILVRVHMCACIAVCQPGNRRRIYLWMHVHACTHTCICMHMPKRVRKNCARAISVRMPACVCLHACVLASAACMHV